jgi:hypothetical protein
MPTATLSEDPSCTDTSLKCYTELDKDREIIKYKTPVLYLNEIPEAMDKMHWTVAAKMMRYWFKNPAWHMPIIERQGYYDKDLTVPVIYEKLPPERINEDIITMKWARGFSRFEKVLDEYHSMWNNGPAIKLLIKRLEKAGWRPGISPSITLGKVGEKASVMDNINKVNSRTFGNYFDTLDDFYGAIFKANLKVAVVGYTYFDRQFCKDMFVVTDTGYYIRDTYDFNDGDKIQDKAVDVLADLGIWSKDRVLSKNETLEYDSMFPLRYLDKKRYQEILLKYRGFVKVGNSDFYRWADKHKTGGDFYVFSDVLWEKPVGGRFEIVLPTHI